MNLFRTLWLKFRSLGQRRAVKQEIDDELRFHIEQRTAENITAGMSPEDAAREARSRFGNMQSIREECRATRGASFGETTLQDVRFGLRMLRKNPGFTAVAVLTLALGVGATTAIFSVVNTVLLNPVPGPQPERVVQIAERIYTHGNFQEEKEKPFFVGVSPPEFDALLAGREFFSDLAWYDSVWTDRKTEDFVSQTRGSMVSGDFFKIWRIQPILGRTFAPDEATPVSEDDIPVKDSVIVLSYSLWQTLFGGDQAVIGRTIEMSARHFTVIGVMLAWFQPEGAYPMFWFPAEPLRLPPTTMRLGNTRVVARLRPDSSTQQAQAMLDTVAGRLMKDHEGDVRFGYGVDWRKRPQGLGFWIRPLRAEFDGSYGTEDFRRTLYGLLGAIVFVLLIVCANIANLMLARTERRQHELAIRAAIGAGRARLMRQLLTESLLLACLGGLGGAAVTVWGMKLLLSMVPPGMPRLQPVAVDGHVLACALLVSIATGLLFGLMPAWRAGRTQLGEALKQAGTGATVGAGRSRYRSALVVAEVALAVVLLAGAGLMIESVIRMLHVDPGFDPENLLYVNLSLPWETYNDQAHPERARQLRNVLFAQLNERLAALPGVKAVGVGKHGAWSEKLKVGGQGETVELVREGCGTGPNDLFRAMRIPLRAGRFFETQDVGAETAIINETMARTIWPGENAVGKKFGGDSSYGSQVYQVVGVVGDIRDYSFKQPVRPTFYRPVDELRLEGMAPFLVIRTQADPQSLVPLVRKELKAAEPAMKKPAISVVRQNIYDSTQAQRTYMIYLVVFAGVGLLLCAIGIYGVLAYSVARRTREIGIRMAVGAQRADVLKMVMVEGARLVLIGVGAGLLAAFWLTRFLRSQLFEVSPTDPVVMAEVVLLLLAVSLLACYMPARRAMKIEPMTALRYE
jgi:predicted permease